MREGAGPSCRPEREKERGRACCPAGPRLAGPRGGGIGPRPAVREGKRGRPGLATAVFFSSFFF